LLLLLAVLFAYPKTESNFSIISRQQNAFCLAVEIFFYEPTPARANAIVFRSHLDFPFRLSRV
jgi:hypothetical protein